MKDETPARDREGEDRYQRAAEVETRGIGLERELFPRSAQLFPRSAQELDLAVDFGRHYL